MDVIEQFGEGLVGYVITTSFCCGNNDEAGQINRLCCCCQLLNKCDTSLRYPHIKTVEIFSQRKGQHGLE